MKAELIDPFYEELRTLMYKYRIKTISGITIDSDNEPDILGATFDNTKNEMMKDVAFKIAELFKPYYDVDKIITGSIKGTK
jgi:hypothetical protein